MTLTADKPIEVRFALTFDDYWSVNWRATRGLVLRLGFVVGLTAAATVVAAIVADVQPDGRASTQLFVIPAVMCLAFAAAIRAILVAPRKTWRATPAVQEARTHAFTAEGVSIEGESFRGFQSWRNFTSAEFTAEFLLLRLGPRQFVVTPLRDVPDDDSARLEDLVASKVADTRVG